MVSTIPNYSVNIIINSFKSDLRVLEPALKSIISSKNISIKSIVIVDYGTDAKILERISSINSRLISIIRLEKDPGLLSMRAIGLRSLDRGDDSYVAFIDNDVFVNKYTLYKLVTILEDNKELGSVSPIITTVDGKLQWFGVFADKTCFAVNEIPPLEFIDDKKNIIYTAYPLGALFVMHYETAVKTIVPCPGIKFWYEDFIIGLRLWLNGTPSVVTPSAYAYHIGGFTRRKPIKHDIKVFLRKNVLDYYRSRVIACKHLFGYTGIFSLLAIVLLDIIRFNLLRELAGKKIKLTTLYSILGVVRGLKDIKETWSWNSRDKKDYIINKILKHGLAMHYRLILTSTGKKYRQIFTKTLVDPLCGDIFAKTAK